MRDDIERQKEVGAAEQAFATVVISSSSYRLCGGCGGLVTKAQWETSEVTTAAKAMDQSTVLLLSHRIRHCRNLQQLLQAMRWA